MFSNNLYKTNKSKLYHKNQTHPNQNINENENAGMNTNIQLTSTLSFVNIKNKMARQQPNLNKDEKKYPPKINSSIISYSKYKPKTKI